MTDVVCPFDNCDYSGPVGSVEAHISGSGGGEHRGEFGADHRADLVEQAEEKLNGGGVPVESKELGDATETDGRADASSSGATEGGEAATSSGSKVPPSKALIGASLLFALAAFTGSSGGTAVDSAAEEDAEEDAEEPGGGLIG
jgi:hypothetical protein